MRPWFRIAGLIQILEASFIATFDDWAIRPTKVSTKVSTKARSQNDSFVASFVDTVVGSAIITRTPVWLVRMPGQTIDSMPRTAKPGGPSARPWTGR